MSLMARIDRARNGLQAADKLLSKARGLLERLDYKLRAGQQPCLPDTSKSSNNGYAGAASDAIKALHETCSLAHSGLKRNYQLLDENFDTPFGEGTVRLFNFTEEQSNPTIVNALRQLIPDGSQDEWRLPIVPPIDKPSPINPAFNEQWQENIERGLTRRSLEVLTVTMPTPPIPGDLLSTLPFITEDETTITIGGVSAGAYLGGERTEVSAEATVIEIERQLTLGSEGNTLQYGTGIGEGASAALYHGEDTDRDGQKEYGIQIPLRRVDIGIRFEPEAVMGSIENFSDLLD